MGFAASAPARAIEKKVADNGTLTTAKDDKPCSRCGHVRSDHAPASCTRMYCEVRGCSCEGYFPPKSYAAVVSENLTLRRRIGELEASVKQLSMGSQVGCPKDEKPASASLLTSQTSFVKAFGGSS